MNYKSNKGFTLIEMLVVVAIIAILASVFLVGLRGFRGSAYDSRRLADLQKVQSYLELYYNQERSYPQNIGSWDQLEDAVVENLEGISKLPDDPISAQHYGYASCGTQGYALNALLSDPNASVIEDSLLAEDMAACGEFSNGTSKSLCGKEVSGAGLYCTAF